MASGQALVSPKQAARAIGVSESSLKRWCDSGLLQSIRTAGGHRKISVGEVIRFANENGTRLVAPEEFSLSIIRKNPRSAALDCHERLAKSLLNGNENAAQQILIDLFLANRSISSLCDEVIAPAFHEIGERWSCRATGIYQERRACEILLGTLVELRRLLPSVSERRLAIGGTISGDHYEIPSAMAELVLRSVGFDARNLGTSIPIEDLMSAVTDLRPQLLWVSVSHLDDDRVFIEGFQKLSSTCARIGTSLVVGGRVLHEDLRRRLSYSAFCDTMMHLETFARSLKRLSAKQPPSNSVRQPKRRGDATITRPNALRRKQST